MVEKRIQDTDYQLCLEIEREAEHVEFMKVAVEHVAEMKRIRLFLAGWNRRLSDCI
jgi:hypothetical protein